MAFAGFPVGPIFPELNPPPELVKVIVGEAGVSSKSCWAMTTCPNPSKAKQKMIEQTNTKDLNINLLISVK
ncbi:MAG: hypothetical protein EDM75_16225 [Chlorobiota bacterium]|nr:MAG: hypothetical protein EDM75_16225 [Chlorobiota bacterium]